MKKKPFPGKLREINVTYSSGLPPVEDRIQITSSHDAYMVLREEFNEELLEYREEFRVLFLNRANHVLGVNTYSTGSAAGTLVCTRQVLGAALKANVSAIILCHNHPSGNTNPSESDLKMTRQIKDSADIMGLSVHDHIIITRDSYFSFADNGQL